MTPYSIRSLERLSKPLRAQKTCNVLKALAMKSSFSARMHAAEQDLEMIMSSLEVKLPPFR